MEIEGAREERGNLKKRMAKKLKFVSKIHTHTFCKELRVGLVLPKLNVMY